MDSETFNPGTRIYTTLHYLLSMIVPVSAALYASKYVEAINVIGTERASLNREQTDIFFAETQTHDRQIVIIVIDNRHIVCSHRSTAPRENGPSFSAALMEANPRVPRLLEGCVCTLRLCYITHIDNITSPTHVAVDLSSKRGTLDNQTLSIAEHREGSIARRKTLSHQTKGEGKK